MENLPQKKLNTPIADKLSELGFDPIAKLVEQAKDVEALAVESESDSVELDSRKLLHSLTKDLLAASQREQDQVIKRELAEDDVSDSNKDIFAATFIEITGDDGRKVVQQLIGSHNANTLPPNSRLLSKAEALEVTGDD